VRLVSSPFFRGDRSFHGKLSAPFFSSVLATQVAIVVIVVVVAVIVVVVTDTDALGGSIATD